MMDGWDRKIQDYKKEVRKKCVSEKAEERTVRICQNLLIRENQRFRTSYFEFLYQQSKYIRKRWWVLQGIVLGYLWFWIKYYGQDQQETIRLIGVLATAFAVLIVPEIWKNRRNKAVEIELVSYYDLRQVCAARTLLFAAVDLLIIMIFLAATCSTGQIPLYDLAVDFLLTMAVYVYTFPRRRSAQATGAVMSFLYMPVMMAFVCRTRNLPQGIFLYFLIFICASVSDVCALAVGMAIGRHKLAPVLSPKKTIEGAIGGIAGSAIVSCLLALVVGSIEKGANVLTLFLIIGICGSIIGQTGDLAASAIKRNHGIKDYGTLIPGHGGMMDRFDSILFTAPVIYYLSFLLSEMM